MRVVLDTNVLLAGMLTRGLCEAVLDACIDSDEHTIVLSEYILREFARQAEEKFGVPAEKARRAVEFLRSHAERVEPVPVAANACQPEKGVRILLCRAPEGPFRQKGPDPFFWPVAARADCLVTGDRDLLELKEYDGRPILTPRAFHERLM